MKNYFFFIFTISGFIAILTVNILYSSMQEIQDNWAYYRCNPPYWVFSKNISDDFTYCVQNVQANMMDYYTQPLNYMVTSLSSIGMGFTTSINDIRGVVSSIRSYIGDIVDNVFGVFLNIIVEFQKITISIKDSLGKIIGLVATIMYVLDGTYKTMTSTWNGPPGQLVRSIGSCFHPNTKVKLKNGEIYDMKDLPLGAELADGSIIFSVMKIANLNKEPLYKIAGGIEGEPIYVTGSHFIYDIALCKWVQVKDYKHATLQNDVQSDWFSCLITTSRQIKIANHFFWDWEDDELLTTN